jgi:hypothetical protein
MARKDVKEIFNQFNAEQKQFVATKKIEANFKIKKWLELLENVAIMDTYADDLIKKLNKLKWTFGISGLVIVFITLFLMAIPYAASLFLIALVSFVLCFINYLRQKRFKQFDLANGLRLFTIPLMKVLREETDKENTIEMKLDFNNPLSKDYLIKKIDNTSKSYPKVDTYIYKNQWINANTKLLEDVEVEWNITDMIVKKHVTKRSSSGKYKTKTKIKIKHGMRLTIAFPKSNFKLVNTPKDFPYIDKNDSHIFKLKGKTNSDSLDTTLDMNYFLDAIATAFSCVQPLKA